MKNTSKYHERPQFAQRYCKSGCNRKICGQLRQKNDDGLRVECISTHTSFVNSQEMNVNIKNQYLLN